MLPRNVLQLFNRGFFPALAAQFHLGTTIGWEGFGFPSLLDLERNGRGVRGALLPGPRLYEFGEFLDVLL